MLIIKEGRYVSKIFYSELPDGLGSSVGNVLAVIYKDTDKPWEAFVRVRRYVDDKTHYSEDPKSAFMLQGTQDKEAIASRVKGMLDTVTSVVAPNTIDVVDVESDDPEAVVRALSSRPWAHARMEPVGTA